MIDDPLLRKNDALGVFLGKTPTSSQFATEVSPSYKKTKLRKNNGRKGVLFFLVVVTLHTI